MSEENIDLIVTVLSISYSPFKKLIVRTHDGLYIWGNIQLNIYAEIFERLYHNGKYELNEWDSCDEDGNSQYPKFEAN